MPAKIQNRNPPKPLKEVALPRTLDVLTKPASDSPLRTLVLECAPKPEELAWYPDLPMTGATIWAIWRNGKCGYAKFEGDWTYKAANGEFVNEMPIAWHVA